MSRKRHRSERERRSPTDTVSDATEELMTALNIPDLHAAVPQRLEDDIRSRVEALLYQLKESKHQRYPHALEIRLVRDAHRAVLTAYELGLKDSEVWYANFRHLTEELGYTRATVGFSKPRPQMNESES